MPEIILDFDPAAAKRLAPGQSIAFAQAPGLRMEASSTGRRWVYRYRSPIDNALRQIKLGAWPGMPPHRAVDKWDERRRERDAGHDPAMERRKKRKAVREQPSPKTVGAIAAKYVEVLGEYDPKKKAPRRTEHGRAEVKRMFAYDLDPIRNRNPVDITGVDANRFLKGVKDRAPNVALRLKRELTAAWREAVDVGDLQPDAPNPWQWALKGKLAQGKRERVLTAGEVRALMRFLPAYGPLVADALELTLRTGLRSGEVVALRSKWFDEDRDGVLWAEIPASFMKQRRAHRVPFVGRARAIADARRDKGELLFPSPLPKRHISQKALGVAVFVHRTTSETRPKLERPRCPVGTDANGVEWAPHDLRRTAATLLGDLGCAYHTVEMILAHQLPGVASIYNRAEVAGQRVEWLTKLNAHINAIAASESLRQIPRRKSA